MPNGKSKIDVDKWSVRLGLPYYEQFAYDYNFGARWGGRFGKSIKISTKKTGSTINAQNVVNSHRNLNSILDHIIEGDWSESVNVYSGLIAFCFKYCKDKITYYEDNKASRYKSIIKCCEELKFPTWCRARLEKIFKMQHSLKDYLEALNEVKNINLDIDSALWVHQLQGDKAVFSILMQAFWYHKYVYVNNFNLVPELPIIWKPEVSNLVSGTSFPVIATKFSNEFEWRYVNEGFFLFDEFDNPIDCASVGSFNVFNEILGNRMSFLGRCGEWPSYVICWSWLDLINAVKLFGDDVLVRNMNGSFYGWFRFGLGGEVVAFSEGRRVYARNSNKYIPDLKIKHKLGEGKHTVVINLAGQYINKIPTERPTWAWDELCDWFELGKMCKTALKR